jgi:hypothetical protein
VEHPASKNKVARPTVTLISENLGKRLFAIDTSSNPIGRTG